MEQPTFRGRFSHSMDAKGRTSIPSAFRTELERASDGPPFLTPQPGCLALYPREGWLAIERRLSRASPMRPDLQRLRRFLLSGAVECPIDAQGRILVPPPLREHAKLQREVMIAGVGSVIEIWDKGRLEANLATIEDSFDELSAAFAALGL